MRDLPIPHAIDEVEATYSTVIAHMLTAMRETNEKKQPIEMRPTDVTDWAQVVRQLARQAKRRSIIFFRRVKHTLLTPPGRSTLPAPTRKIQRILQRNTPWSTRALDLVPPQPITPDPPPPHGARTHVSGTRPQKKIAWP